MRLAFMGTPEFAVPLLAELTAGHDIAAVYSQPARPQGRGYAEEPSPVAKFAIAHELLLRTPATLKTEAGQAAFAALGVDAAVVAAYGLMLPKPILEAPRLGCFNLHASLLPRWRGAAPIQRAVMAGDAETGVTVMHMDTGLDTGAVLMEERLPVGRRTGGELTNELARFGASLMVRALAALERGNIAEHPQSEDGVSYAKKILKQETRIDWAKGARDIDGLIRALSPAPGAWTQANGERLKILYAEPVAGSGAPGELLDDNLTVACGCGALRLVRLQRAGRGVMAACELLRGFSLPRGLRLV
ncbi:MAG: methionyl-tRNA formyltransferase [Alphaproteobacteria bacterium]|nr:methionyl-tRNA formyltransferase [Alphaproteobacteria bacterium]MDE2629990.1 methionyl-tRNA formyltransferase [Alphaproteobacteria bacterium]